MVQCSVLKVSRSGYYKWLNAEPSKTQQKQLKIVSKIKQLHSKYEQSYGSPRMHRELQAESVDCCENTVAKLMRREGIAARTRRRFKVVTTDSNHDSPIAANLLGRDFQVEKPNQVWLTDFTYLHTQDGISYLCAVEDLCSRKIVGWAVSKKIDAALACKALQQAIDLRSPDAGLILHSDRGSQYASDAFRGLLDSNAIQQSMSRKGNCYDNAPMESFFGRLKTEYAHWQDFTTIDDVTRKITKYVSQFYNVTRRHSSLGYVSPVEYETKKLYKSQLAS